MILEYLDDHGRPARVVASRVVIREASTLTPVMVAADFDRAILASKAGDSDFAQMLQVTGVQETVLVTHMHKEDLILPGIQ